MAEIRFALIGEGSTDEALLPIIQWLLREHLPVVDVVGIWANRGQATVPHARSLAERIVRAVAGFPCEILFVHRDADSAGRDTRVDEIERAAAEARMALEARQPVISVVPVRETEAWLLFDEAALRWGSWNPNGRVRLTLPRPNRIERLSDPKRAFGELLLTASELRGRHRDRLKIDPVRVAN